MSFEGVLTAAVAADLPELADWIASHESPAKAAQVVDRIEAAFSALARFPHRGAHPRELLELIADGRRDLQELLARRLLGA